MLTATMPQTVSSRSADEELLQAFAGSESEKAFRALVEKYLGMVLGIATRRTGDRAMAEEIAQDVFSILARKAKRLKCGPTLAGWIHRVTVIECAEAMRREISAKTKMNAVSRHLASETDGRDVWHDALPLLDEGINELSQAEREIILLRFFERKSFREIGTALGKTDDAAQKQTERALQKLSGLLKRKGLSVPVALLTTGLAAHFTQAAPPALAQAITNGALTAASALNAKIFILETLQAMTNTKLKTAILATVVLSIPIVMQKLENNRLREALNSVQPPPFLVRNSDMRSGTTTPGNPSDPLIASVAPSASSFGPDAVIRANADQVPGAHDWEHVLFIADPLQRTQRLSQLLAALTAESAPQIAEAFKRAKDAGIKFADEQRLFLRAWGKLDGATAVNYAISLSGQSSEEAVAALGGWAATDPQQAKTWLEGLSESGEKEKLVYGLLDGWSTIDFQAAAAFAESRPSSPARDRFRELLLQRALRSGGIAAAQSWVSSIPENDQNRQYKRRAFADVVQAMLYRDPAAAARWIAESDGQSFLGGTAVANTASKLADTSPTDALNWLATLKATNPEIIGRGTGAVLQTWAGQNPEAAGAWLQQNSNHPHYDQIVASYARSIVAVDRDAANAWVQTIRNPQLREAALAKQLSYNVTMLQTADGISGTLDPGRAGAVLTDWISLDTSSTYAAVEYGTRVSELSVGAKNGAQFEGVSGDLIIAPSPKHPHGPGAQWSNCSSCHPK